MYTLLSTTAALAVIMMPAVQAHMAAWHPSGYGFKKDWEAATPLFGKSYNEWWFHGYINEKPSEVLSLVPGSTLNMEIACSKDYTTYGRNPNSDACPIDAGSYHAGGSTGSASGWGGNSEDNLMGCALAIAYKSNVYDVKPEDFVIMSIQERCVRQRDTPFEIPANLPACPDGECTCAWFWGGKNSATEMYMQGFRCNVQGGVITNSFPQPTPPKKGNNIGPRNPSYFANDLNNLGFEPDWGTKPSYNSAWGWKNGAQTEAFEGLGGNGNAPVNTTSAAAGPTGGNGNGDGNGDGSQSSTYVESASSTSSRRRRPRPTTSPSTSTSTSTALGGDWYNHVADPTASSASSAAAAKPTGKKCKRSLRSRTKKHKARGHKRV